MKILKKISLILFFLVAALLVCVILFNLITAIKRAATGDPCPTVFGIATAVVGSGSMEPAIMTGDLVVIRACEEYNTGDIVTFHTGGTPVTHRIVDTYTVDGTLYFTTHGDFNPEGLTETVPASSVIGKVVLILPRFGILYGFLQKPMGFIGLTFVLAAYILLPDLIARMKQKKQKDKEEKAVSEEKQCPCDKAALQQQIAALEEEIAHREKAAQKRKFWGLVLLGYLAVIAIVLILSYARVS